MVLPAEESSVRGRSLLDPFSTNLDSVSPSTQAIINAAFAEAGSGDATRSGAHVFSVVEDSLSALQANFTTESSLFTIYSLLYDATLSMKEVFTLVSHPEGDSLDSVSFNTGIATLGSLFCRCSHVFK